MSLPHIVVVFNRPTVREVCPEYDMVEFQPRTLTLPYLGSVAFHYILIYPLRPKTISPFFWIIPSPIFPTDSPSVAILPLRPLVFHPPHIASPGENRRPPRRCPY